MAALGIEQLTPAVLRYGNAGFDDAHKGEHSERRPSHDREWTATRRHRLGRWAL